MATKKKKSDEIVVSSKEELEAEVQKELNKFIREEKKLAKDPAYKSKSKAEDFTLQDIIVKEDSKLQESVKLVARMTDFEKIDWLIEKHNDMIVTLNYSMNLDVLNGTEYIERYLCTVYQQELINLLHVYNFEFSKEMVDILISENQVELLSILNVLNFI
jgi:hypothetical protein